MKKIYFEAKAKKSKLPIEKVIQNLGINYPNESLGFLHAVYAKVDGKTPNKNKVILAKTVKQDVTQLKFTQANINHKRTGYVIGTILDAWVNKNDQIEIVFSFFKSLYPKEWEIVEKATEDDEMSVSFELMVENDDIQYLAGGIRKLKRVTFDGVGLLFPGVPPAYPDAKVLQSANAIVNNVFENKQNLICASAKDAVAFLEKELNSNKSEGETKMDKKAREALLAKFKAEVTAELGEEAVKDWSDEQWEAELKRRAEAEEQTDSETTEASENEAEESEDKEQASEEETTEEKTETEEAEEETEEKPKKEEAQKKIVEEDKKVKTTVTYDDETKEETVETESETTVKRDGKETMREEKKDKITYTYAQVEEIKADYEKKLEEKNQEIAFLKEKAQKIVEIRKEYGEFVQDLSDEELFDETKMEIVALKKENAELKKAKALETAEEETEEEETQEETSEEAKEKDEDLKTGHDEKEQKEEETANDRVSQYLKQQYGNK